MIFVRGLCSLDIPDAALRRNCSTLVELLKNLSSDTGDIFSKVSAPGAQQDRRISVLNPVMQVDLWV